MTATRCAPRPVPQDVIERLKVAVGPGGALEGEADTAAYCVSWRDDWVGRVPLVLRPKSTEEVSRIVVICAEAGVVRDDRNRKTAKIIFFITVSVGNGSWFLTSHLHLARGHMRVTARLERNILHRNDSAIHRSSSRRLSG